MNPDQQPSQAVTTVKQFKLSHVITAVLCITLAGVIYFGWTYLNKISPVEDVLATFMPVRQPQWVATIYGENGILLNQPRKVHVAGNEIYVSDTSNNRVVVFDYQGHFIRKFGDTGKVRLVFPYGITVVGERVFVADAGLMKVATYDRNGRFTGFFAEYLIRKPVDVIHHQGRLYFTDVARHQVVVTDMAGKELLSFGKPGKGPAEMFWFPNGVAVTSDGRILVADTNNSRIQVFSAEGAFLEIWQGDVENGNTYFATPTSLALDKADNVYAADPLTQRIMVLDRDGHPVGALQAVGPQNEGDALSLPFGVCVDNRQRLYVADYGGSRVVIYDLK